MSKKGCTFAAVMEQKKDNKNVDWNLVLKVTIAILTAIAATIGASKSDVVADVIDGVFNKSAEQ